MEFIKWSDINPGAKVVLQPNLGIKNWDQLDLKERTIIYQHFINKGWFIKTDDNMYAAVKKFSEDHKASSFCNHLLNHGGPHYYSQGSFREVCCNEAAEQDLQHIFLREPQDVVYQLVSYYAEQVIEQDYNKDQYLRFVRMFNDISDQFGLNVLLVKNGLILRQDPKIEKEIYEPVLKFLSDKKWEAVSRELGDANVDYLKNTPEGFSSCITHAISGLQAFLQILVLGKIGKGEIGNLVEEARSKKFIESDMFSEKILKNIESVLAVERQTKGDPHPKKEYASEKTARLVLNLVMISIQHCMQVK